MFQMQEITRGIWSRFQNALFLGGFDINWVLILIQEKAGGKKKKTCHFPGASVLRNGVILFNMS